jgi:hypothetical protein
MGLEYSYLTEFCRRLRGGSQPILARASDGRRYVVKFANNLQGRNLLFNEAAGSLLYRACGLPVPEWTPLHVPASFLDEYPEAWIETERGLLRPEEGLCFGSCYVESENRILEILPLSGMRHIRNRANFWLAWLVDLCADHADNRQALFIEDQTGMLNAMFIDHGHLFGGADGMQIAHPIVSRYLDPRIYEQVSSPQFSEVRTRIWSVNKTLLRKELQKIPPEWMTATALNNFSDCLLRMSSFMYLRNAADRLARLNGSAYEHVVQNSEPERRPAHGILCFGVPGTY